MDNSFLNNPKIQEVEEEEMDNYNIINNYNTNESDKEDNLSVISLLNEKEKFYIDFFKSYDFGLNSTRGNN